MVGTGYEKKILKTRNKKYQINQEVVQRHVAIRAASLLEKQRSQNLKVK